MNSKVATTEKLRSRYQMDLDELQNESERINTQLAVADKKLQTFDKVTFKVLRFLKRFTPLFRKSLMYKAMMVYFGFLL